MAVQACLGRVLPHDQVWNVPGRGDSLEMPSFDRVVREAGSADQCRRAVMKSTERSYMYAVVKTGGKQYKVAAGEKIKVEQIAADVGQEIGLEQALAVGKRADLTVGAPLVAGASGKANVVAQSCQE